MYYVNGTRYDEDPNAKLGGGSEGAVYPYPVDPALCVKLFHAVDPGDADGARIAQYRARKIAAVCGLGLNLGDQFVLPQTAVHDAKRHTVGFLMRRVPIGFHKFLQFLQPQFRTSHTIGLKEVVEFYARLFEDLGIVHGKGLVIGDVNMGCLLFTPKLDRAWVDTDSWSYPGFPCVATTELFAHPDLFPNLSSSGKFVEPQAHHDRFAFTVAFALMALPGAHPFRMGAHASVHGLQDRARRGITIFDSSVEYPMMLPKPELLSDELLEQIIQRLKQKTAEPLKPEDLRAFAKSLVQCKNCGAQYYAKRSQCPQCQEKTIIDLAALAELLIQEVLQVSGVLLFAQAVGDVLHVVCRVDDTVRIVTVNAHGRTSVIPTTITTVPGAKYRFFGSCLAVCPNPNAEAPAAMKVYHIDGGKLIELPETSTAVLENEAAVFDASARFLYRIAGNTLICDQLFGGRTLTGGPVTQVYRSQTWFTVDRTGETDREVIFGYDRALKDWDWFIIRGDKDGRRFVRQQVGALPMRAREKLEDFAVYFAASSVLLVRKTSYRGQEYVRYSTIGLDGSIASDVLVDQSDEGFACWEQIRGKLFQGKSVLHVTPSGIVKQSLDRVSYTTLRDTSGIVTASDRLVRLGNTVGIIRRDSVLTMKKKVS